MLFERTVSYIGATVAVDYGTISSKTFARQTFGHAFKAKGIVRV